jgi:hypothetical protein
LTSTLDYIKTVVYPKVKLEHFEAFKTSREEGSLTLDPDRSLDFDILGFVLQINNVNFYGSWFKKIDFSTQNKRNFHLELRKIKEMLLTESQTTLVDTYIEVEHWISMIRVLSKTFENPQTNEVRTFQISINDEFDYSSVKSDEQDLNHIQFGMSIYFAELKVFLLRLIDLIDRVRPILPLTGKLTPQKIIKEQFKKNNWDDHSKHEWDNMSMLKEGLELYLAPKEIRKFYNLLNSNKNAPMLTWLGQVNELRAFIDGIAGNSNFGSPNRKFAYFKHAFHFIGAKGKLRLLSEIQLKHYDYDAEKANFGALIVLGLNLK